LRIAQVIDSLKVGGAQKLMTVFAREMQRAGHSISVVSLTDLDNGSPVLNELLQLNVEVIHVPMNSLVDARAFNSLCRTIRSSGADITHTQLNYANILGTLASKKAGIPSVASLHNASVHLHGYKPYRTWLESAVLRMYARRIIACGYTVARVQQPRFGSKALQVIPNPVPEAAQVTRQEIQSLRKQFLPGGNGLLVISVGRLIPEKGYSDLLQAFQKARQKIEAPVRLLIAGKGPLLQELRNETARLDLKEAVFFLGEREDVPALLAAGDIYAGASLFEGQSLAVLEAMQSGLAVVVTDVGDNRRAVAEGCGRVIPSGSSEALAEAMISLANDPDERKRLGAAAARHARANYSASVWAERWLDLYSEVLHG